MKSESAEKIKIHKDNANAELWGSDNPLKPRMSSIYAGGSSPGQVVGVAVRPLNRSAWHA